MAEDVLAGVRTQAYYPGDTISASGCVADGDSHERFLRLKAAAGQCAISHRVSEGETPGTAMQKVMRLRMLTLEQ